MRVRTSAIVALMAVFGAACATAQPSPHGVSCRVQLNRLHSDPHSEAFRRTISDGGLRNCGNEASGALARELNTRAATLSQAGVLDQVVLIASGLRHPDLFDAALRLLDDGSGVDPV
jgi:hypothetical protein